MQEQSKLSCHINIGNELITFCWNITGQRLWGWASRNCFSLECARDRVTDLGSVKGRLDIHTIINLNSVSGEIWHCGTTSETIRKHDWISLYLSVWRLLYPPNHKVSKRDNLTRMTSLKWMTRCSFQKTWLRSPLWNKQPTWMFKLFDKLLPKWKAIVSIWNKRLDIYLELILLETETTVSPWKENPFIPLKQSPWCPMKRRIWCPMKHTPVSPLKHLSWTPAWIRYNPSPWSDAAMTHITMLLISTGMQQSASALS